MKRFLLNYLLPLALPFLAYGGWLIFLRYKARKAGEEGVKGWSAAPLTWLAITGVGLALVGLIALGFVGNEKPGGKYIPPKFVDGKIVPGHTVPE